MSQRWMVGCGLVLAGVLLAIAGCWGGGPSRVEAPPLDPATAAAEAMKMYDTNNDGSISGAELDKSPAIKSAITKIDPSGTGKVTADMIAARIQKWKDSKLGRMSLGCKVMRNGSPLSGATVTFYPEKFLGPGYPQATGKSDENGNSMISCVVANPSPTGKRELPGVAPGLYRVVVTVDGMNIPPKYSTEAGTVLGQEVAMDAVGLQQGIKFDLRF